MPEGFSSNPVVREGGLADPLLLPGAAASSKLPLPNAPEVTSASAVPPELRDAWVQFMVQGFKQNQQMFRSTLDAFMKPYRLTVWLYATLFVLGVGLFVVAAIVGLQNGSSVVAVAFAGLSVTSLLAFFVKQPLHALEENLEFITWLGVAFNTYWTRLMYMSDSKTVQVELKGADDDFRTSVERLIARHTEARAKRPEPTK